MKTNFAHTSILLPTSAREDSSVGDQLISPAARILLPGNGDDVFASLRGYFVLPDHPIITPTRRFVVVIPENEFNEVELAHRLWNLAEPGPINILLVTLAAAYRRDAYLRRRLATLAAITEDKKVRVRIEIAEERSWASVINRILRTGDLILCIRGQARRSFGIRSGDLGEHLSALLDAPVLVLSGFKLGWPKVYLNLFKETAGWLSAIMLLTSFLWLQIHIGEALNGGVYVLVMILLVFIEIALLYAINLLIG